MFRWLKNRVYGKPHVLPPPLPLDYLAVEIGKNIALKVIADSSNVYRQILDRALQQLADERVQRT